MASREQLQIISAGVLRDFVGQALSVGTTPTAVAVWPAAATSDRRAIQVIIRPVTNAVWLSLDKAVGVPDDPAAQLAGNVEYVLPIHPDVNTLFFIAPAATTALVRHVLSG